MQDVKIIVTEDNGTVIGSLDLSKPTDFPLSLTKSIASIKDISKRNTYYSLDFNVPSTHNNNIILFGVKQINSTLNLKTILNKKRCLIYVGGNLLERGFVRFSLSTFEGDYRATFFGGNADWVELLSEVDLNQLDWENLNEAAPGVELFTGTRITEVSQGDSDDYDISYPYIDRNASSNTTSFRPVLYMRKVIQRMFEKIGYTVDSNFLDSTFVKGDGLENKGLALDPAATFTIDQKTIDLNSIDYSTDRLVSAGDPNLWDVNYIMGNVGVGLLRTESKLPNFFNILTQDNGGVYDPVNSVYSVNVTGEYNIKLDLPDYLLAMDVTPSGGVGFALFNDNFNPSRGIAPLVVYFVVKNNVSPTVIDGTILYTTDTPGRRFSATSFNEKILLNSGDNISIWFRMKDNASGFGALSPFMAYRDAPNSLQYWRFSLGVTANLSIQRSASVGINDNYNINSHLPTNLSCLDVLQDLKVLHNLYFVPNPQRKTIKIEPRDEFYQDIVNAEDITNRIDLNKTIETDYLSEYKRNLVFRYKNDDKDGYLERWNTNNLRTYAEYRHVMSNRFEKGDTTFELKLIAPTIQGLMSPSEIVTSRILQHWEDSENALLGINEEYAMRYYQLVRNQQFNRDGTPRRAVSPFVVEAGLAEEFGNVSLLNNGVNNQLTFNGANGLFAKHYAKTATNIEQLAVVGLSQLMTLDQFRNLDFSRPVYISSPAEIQGYYIYESVDNFDGIEEKPVKCKLLRWRNWVGAAVDLTQSTNVSLAVLNPQNTPPLEALLYIYNENDPLLPTTYEQVVEPEPNTNNIVPIYNT